MNPVNFKFEDLKSYQKAIVFIDTTCKVSARFLNQESFKLVAPFKRLLRIVLQLPIIKITFLMPKISN